MEGQNEDDLNLDMAEVKRALEDANMAEPNMPEDLMIQYYKALTNSKNTASEEDEVRRLNESQKEAEELLLDAVEDVEITPVQSKEKPFKPKTWTSQKKLPLEGAFEHNNNKNIQENASQEVIDDSAKDATKVVFGFNDMPESSEETKYTVITHELKFVPIQNSPKFINADIALKAKMLYAYHTKMSKARAEFARQSFYPAPLPKAISTTETYSSFSDANNPETYICRSGRQTKRKIYNYDEDEDSLDGTVNNNKKAKSNEEQDWLSKPTAAKNHPRTQKKQETSKVNVETNKAELDILDGNKEKKSCAKKETKPPMVRKMSNAEIMKRSSLFESPKQRSETIFNKLKEEEEKKQREQKSMDLFNKTLEKLDEENEAILDEDVITVDDEEFVRKRVVPQIPGRKIFNRKRTNPEDSDKGKETSAKKETKTPLNKLSNADVLKRSRMYELPKRQCEILFDELKKEHEENKKKETLKRLDEENEDMITVDDEGSAGMSTSPPRPARKPFNRKRTNLEGLAPLNIKVTSPNQKKGPLAEQNGSNREREPSVSLITIKKRPGIRQKATVEPIDSSPSTSRTSKPGANKVPCPICGDSFEEDKIEGHAATCGDDPVTSSSPNVSRITCNVCDKVVDVNDDYEAHVRECMSKKNAN